MPFLYKATDKISTFLCEYLIIKDLLRDAQKTKPTNMVELTKTLLNKYINPPFFSLTNHTKVEEAIKLLNERK